MDARQDSPSGPPHDLDAVEQRVLGSLLEKQVTVPAAYPLTLNALRTACNQTSSREPVLDLDEREVHETLRALKQRGLARVVWADTGRRTMKHLQTLTEVVDVDDAERALLTVLLLRGPQPAGALRTRTERLHPFADRGAVEACLAGLAARPDPLVRELPRRRGQQDARWVHLLGPVDTGEDDDRGAGAATSAGGPVRAGGPGTDDREQLPPERDQRVRAAYAAVAADYAEAFADELAVLPLERWLLGRVAEEVAPGGLPVVEAGCGPGHVTAHVAGLGLDATGLDLVPEMVEQARARFPGVRFEVGDLRRLVRPPAAAGWGAVLAWYSLVHLAPSELPDAVAALARPLAPGGLLVVATHAGRARLHADRWFDHAVDLDLVAHRREEVLGALEAAGLSDVEWYQRGPIAAREETTERLYVLARLRP